MRCFHFLAQCSPWPHVQFLISCNLAFSYLSYVNFSVIGSIHAVFISHSDLAHLGALPYAMAHLGLSAPVYCTMPVHKMGQMCMYDAYLSRANNEVFETFSLDDVDLCFDRLHIVKYSERIILSANGVQLDALCYSAGHMLGGALWHLKCETDEIVYAVDYNHRKERHLNPSVLETLVRPSVLITDAYNAVSEQIARRNRDKLLFETVMRTLRNGGSCLMPVDAAGRTLELLLLLELYWRSERPPYPLYFLSNTAYSTLEFAKTQLEWLINTA